MLMIYHLHSSDFFDGQCDRAYQRVRGIHPVRSPNEDEQQAPDPKGKIVCFLQKSTLYKRPADHSDSGVFRKLQVARSPCPRSEKDNFPTFLGQNAGGVFQRRIAAWVRVLKV